MRGREEGVGSYHNHLGEISTCLKCWKVLLRRYVILHDDCGYGGIKCFETLERACAIDVCEGI
jgi:hypothetical protein